MSTIAVFIALGGTSYAVARNSVGPAQLRANAVTSAKVRNQSLTSKDLSSSTLKSVRGMRGPAGPSGATGPVGAPGPAAAESWKALPFANGWTNYDNFWESGAYRKDQLGIVHLRGLVTRASGPPAGFIATLPAGYRPQRGRLFVVQMGELAGVGRVDVGPDGGVRWAGGSGGETDYTSLDNISFDTE